MPPAPVMIIVPVAVAVATWAEEENQRRGVNIWKGSEENAEILWRDHSLRIHVWYIYLHLVDFYGKCRYIYHTWILRDWITDFGEIKKLQIYGHVWRISA